jgi:hypothetical protein
MHKPLVHQQRYSGMTKRSLKLSIPVVMLGLVLLEPASPLPFHMQLVQPFLPLLGGAGCIGALRIVLPLLLAPDPD